MSAEHRVSTTGIVEIHPPRFRLVRFDELHFSRDPDCLIKGLIPTTGLVLLWGPPKCGKSFWAFDALMHVAMGWQYRGRKVKRGPVVYCAFEGESGLRKRAEAFRKSKLAGHDEPIPFFLFAGRLALVRDHQALIKSISVQVHPEKPVAIVCDTLNRSLEGSESGDVDMSEYIKAADAIREAFGCVVVIVHHCGVDGSRPRGHTSLTGAIDAQLAVRRDHANNVIVEVQFMKDGPEGDIVLSRLQSVGVGTDTDGDEVSSCVVVPADADNVTANRKAKSGGGATQIALRALAEVIGERGQSRASEHIPASVRVVTTEDWREFAYARGISTSGEPRARQLAFQRAQRSLVASGEVKTWQDQVWILRDHGDEPG